MAATVPLKSESVSHENVRSFRVLGVRVDAVQIADVVRRMEEWIAQRGSCQYIAVTGMHGVTEAQHDAEFKAVLNSAGLVVAEELASRMVARFPGVIAAGTYSPPFRVLTQEEDREVVAAIESARADVVWVGLSTPKQERWMHEHRDRLNVPVLVGVGAAFDFHTGRVAQAPRWMRENGLEWLFRLASEPRRLWRRYLINGSEFAWLVLLELMGWRKFK